MILDGKDPDQAQDLVYATDESRESILDLCDEMEPDTRFDWDLENEYQRLERNGLFISIPRTPPDRN